MGDILTFPFGDRPSGSAFDFAGDEVTRWTTILRALIAQYENVAQHRNAGLADDWRSAAQALLAALARKPVFDARVADLAITLRSRLGTMAVEAHENLDQAHRGAGGSCIADADAVNADLKARLKPVDETPIIAAQGLQGTRAPQARSAAPGAVGQAREVSHPPSVEACTALYHFQAGAMALGRCLGGLARATLAAVLPPSPNDFFAHDAGLVLRSRKERLEAARRPVRRKDRPGFHLSDGDTGGGDAA